MGSRPERSRSRPRRQLSRPRHLDVTPRRDRDETMDRSRDGDVSVSGPSLLVQAYALLCCNSTRSTTAGYAATHSSSPELAISEWTTVYIIFIRNNVQNTRNKKTNIEKKNRIDYNYQLLHCTINTQLCNA